MRTDATIIATLAAERAYRECAAVDREFARYEKCRVYRETLERLAPELLPTLANLEREFGPMTAIAIFREEAATGGGGW
jgi:hypothetical protein